MKFSVAHKIKIKNYIYISAHKIYEFAGIIFVFKIFLDDFHFASEITLHSFTRIHFLTKQNKIIIYNIHNNNCIFIYEIKINTYNINIK